MRFVLTSGLPVTGEVCFFSSHFCIALSSYEWPSVATTGFFMTICVGQRKSTGATGLSSSSSALFRSPLIRRLSREGDTEDDALYSASTKIVKMPLALLRRFGIVTSIATTW